MDVSSVTGAFTGVPYDWFALGGFLILVALDSLRSGIGRACAIALALPMAAWLYSLVPTSVGIGAVSVLDASPNMQLATFGVIAFITYLIVRRIALEYIESGRGEPIQAILAGGAATAVLIVVWLQLPMTDQIWQLSPSVEAAFSEQYRLFWLMGSYIALAFARG